MNVRELVKALLDMPMDALVVMAVGEDEDLHIHHVQLEGDAVIVYTDDAP